MPQISVVTSVYNGETYLQECVDSILKQTFEDFEYIILNNGSTDGTAEILNGYADPRIRIIHQENLGIARSLNKGIHLANSELIARLDADDYSVPKRLDKQITFMDEHPQIVLCASRFNLLIGKDTFDPETLFIEENKAIRKAMSCFNPISHSTVVFRKKAFIESGCYNEKFVYSQDYDLWLRMLAFGEAHILRDKLNTIRLSDNSTSNQNTRTMRLECLQIRWNAFRKFGGNPGKVLYHFIKSLAGLIFDSKISLNR